MLVCDGRDAAALTLVRVRHPSARVVHYMRAVDYDAPRAKRTDDGGTAICGDQATREEPFSETGEVDRICMTCNARARPPCVIRPKGGQ
jgi:hypothetical protein